jgi:CBS domain-containing protein
MRPDEPVSRIMTEAVVAIEASRPVSEVLDCFLQYSIHHLPVVRNGKLAGMLGSADVMKLEFFVPKSATDRSRFLDERLTIDQLIGQPAVSLKGTTSLNDAAERLIEAGVHAAPVVDDADHVIGIVTTTDIIRSLLHGPPRKGMQAPPQPARPPRSDDPVAETDYRRKPTPVEFETALRTAQVLHVEARDPRFLGKALLYLDQRRVYLEKVLELADRFLLAGQDEHNHALLLKAIYAAKRAEEHATGQARVPFPLQ